MDPDNELTRSWFYIKTGDNEISEVLPFKGGCDDRLGIDYNVPDGVLDGTWGLTWKFIPAPVENDPNVFILKLTKDPSCPLNILSAKPCD